jgi:hypothetical protein
MQLAQFQQTCNEAFAPLATFSLHNMLVRKHEMIAYYI